MDVLVILIALAVAIVMIVAQCELFAIKRYLRQSVELQLFQAARERGKMKLESGDAKLPRFEAEAEFPSAPASASPDVEPYRRICDPVR